MEEVAGPGAALFCCSLGLVVEGGGGGYGVSSSPGDDCGGGDGGERGKGPPGGLHVRELLVVWGRSMAATWMAATPAPLSRTERRARPNSYRRTMEEVAWPCAGPVLLLTWSVLSEHCSPIRPALLKKVNQA